MKYQLFEWEFNGYDDSDGYRVFYDTETGALGRECHWTTRAGMNTKALPAAPQDVIEASRALIAVKIAESAVAYDAVLTNEPNGRDIQRGTILETTRNVRHKGAVIPKGTIGEVFWQGAFGQFYRNGYKDPNSRSYCRVGLRLSDGSKVFVALSACRLNRTPIEYGEAFERAYTQAQESGMGIFHRTFETARVSMI